jgi:hypothetical protein
MTSNPLLGVVFHWLGGFAAGTAGISKEREMPQGDEAGCYQGTSASR